MKAVGQTHATAPLPRKRLHRLSGCLDEEMNISRGLLPWIELRLLGTQLLNLVTVPTELAQHLMYFNLLHVLKSNGQPRVMKH